MRQKMRDQSRDGIDRQSETGIIKTAIIILFLYFSAWNDARIDSLKYINPPQEPIKIDCKLNSTQPGTRSTLVLVVVDIVMDMDFHKHKNIHLISHFIIVLLKF